MAADPLTGLHAFAAVAEKRSFSSAAAELGLTPSAVSQTVKQLEDRLGVRLLQRTTRSVGLTEAGERLLKGIGPALQSIERTIEDIGDLRGTPSGTLRLNAPHVAVELVIEPILPAFMLAYPDLAVEVFIDDARTDIVKGQYDAGIRLGENLDPGMVCVRVGRELSMAVIGAPSYFEAHGVPERPEQLRAHDCIRYREQPSGQIYRWEFDENGREFEIAVDGRLTVSDGATLVRAARAGLGLGFTIDAYVRDDLRKGTLRRVLEEFCSPFQGFYLYYPSRSHVPNKLKAFAEFLRSHVDAPRSPPRERRARQERR